MATSIPVIQVGTDKQIKVIEPVFLTGLGPDGQPKAVSVDADGKLSTAVSGVGDASAANQETQITTLDSIDTRLSDISTKVTTANISTTAYRVVTAFTGAAVGNIILSIQSFDNDGISHLGTAWFNQTTNAFVATPLAANVTAIGSNVATETTLAALSAKLPATLGIKTATNSISVAPASDANFQIGDGVNLVGIATSGADASSNVANRLRVSSLGMGFNGTSVDRLRAGVIGENGSSIGYQNVLPATGSISGASTVSSTTNEASRVLKNSAGTLMSLVGYSARTSSQFIQIFNSTTVPVDTSVPIYTFTVQAGSNFSLDVPVTGIPFTTGITVCNSSTQTTKTIGSADCWFTAVIK